MHATAVQFDRNVPSDIEVISVEFTPHETNVYVESRGAGKRWRVRFYGASGIRILDEGDLLEFWPTCSSSNGWLFQIHSGGWHDQEKNRFGYSKRETHPRFPEYFIAGENTCVCILSVAPPELLNA